MDVGGWLRGLGLGQYEEKFRDNRIDADLLPRLTVDDLLTRLREAGALRNVLCHGSWRRPDSQGKSIPLFVNRQKEVFETSVDVAFLQQTQQAVVQLIVNVMNSVTMMGLQFPGSNGPGDVVFKR